MSSPSSRQARWAAPWAAGCASTAPGSSPCSMAAAPRASRARSAPASLPSTAANAWWAKRILSCRSCRRARRPGWRARQVRSMYPKAYRWVAEMEEIAAFSGGDVAAQQIYRGLARLYERLAEGGVAEDELAQLSDFCRAASGKI